MIDKNDVIETIWPSLLFFKESQKIVLNMDFDISARSCQVLLQRPQTKV